MSSFMLVYAYHKADLIVNAVMTDLELHNLFWTLQFCSNILALLRYSCQNRFLGSIALQEILRENFEKCVS